MKTNTNLLSAYTLENLVEECERRIKMYAPNGRIKIEAEIKLSEDRAFLERKAVAKSSSSAAIAPIPKKVAKPVTAEMVREVVCKAFGISEQAMMKTTKTHRLSMVRQVFIYLCDETYGIKPEKYAELIHPIFYRSRYYAIKKTNERLSSDKGFKAKYAYCTHEIDRLTN